MLPVEEPLLQNLLQVAPAVCDEENVHPFPHDPVDDAVRFEKDFLILANAEGQQFSRVSPPSAE